jgi:hypothetical protein
MEGLFTEARTTRPGSFDFQLVPMRWRWRKPSRTPRGMELAGVLSMTMKQQLKQYIGRRATKRLYRAMPWIGGVVALATVGATVRRKGLLRGTADTVLDFIPWVGGAKNLAEVARGRDFIRDKPTSAATNR